MSRSRPDAGAMGAVVLGLVSGLSWGVADFLGGLASRRAAAFAVVALSQATGLVVALVVAGVVRPDLPPPDKVLLAAAAGLTGVMAVVAALGFGGFFSLLAEAADGGSALWALITARGVSVPVALAVCAAVGASLAIRGRVLLMVVAGGCSTRRPT